MKTQKGNRDDDGHVYPRHVEKDALQVLFSVLLATSSAVLVKQFAPAARGSGIPVPWKVLSALWDTNLAMEMS